MTLPQIIRHVTQLFNLDDPVNRLIAGDWIEQQEEIDETIINLTAAAVRAGVSILEILNNEQRTIQIEIDYKLKINLGHRNGYGHPIEVGDGTGYGCFTGSGEGNNQGTSIGIDYGNSYGEGNNCGSGTGFGIGHGNAHGNAHGFGSGTGYAY